MLVDKELPYHKHPLRLIRYDQVECETIGTKMRVVRFKKIDAFASKKSSGNPAGVVYLNSLNELSPTEMQRVARELRGFVNEVGYVCKGTDTDYQLRFFSAVREVAFCGHATIAILNDIVANDKSLHNQYTLSIQTTKDLLLAENHYARDASIFISAPEPKYTPIRFGKADVLPVLNCTKGNIEKEFHLEIINAGLETLIVPVAGLDILLQLAPDFETLNNFCIQQNIDIVILYCKETSTEESSYRTRVFAPRFGYLEDPATGSGNAALGYYLLKHNMWDGKAITIEQNASLKEPNFVQLCAKTDDKHGTKVWFGGGAITRIDGDYLIWD